MNDRHFTGRMLAAGLALTLCPAAQSADFFDQMRDPQDGWLDASDFLLQRDFAFLPVPIIITEPALDRGLGMAGVFFHDNNDQPKEEFVSPSVSAVAGAYTGNESWFGGAGHRGIWRDDTLHYLGWAGYGSINIEYYGGPEEFGDRGFEFNGEGVFLSQELLVRLGASDWWLGATFEFSQLDIGFELPGENPILPRLEGDFSNAALGVASEYDSRDSVFTPNTGQYLRLSYQRYDETLGGDFDYNNYKTGYRGFWRFSDVVVGLRGDAAVIGGDAPFYAEPYIKMRGIPAMRYQGEAVAVVETELRWDFHPRFSAIGFAGAGRAADSSGKLDSAGTEPAGGIGLRYLLARKMGLRGGFDIGWGPEDTVFYITVGQNWSF